MIYFRKYCFFCLRSFHYLFVFHLHSHENVYKALGLFMYDIHKQRFVMCSKPLKNSNKNWLKLRNFFNNFMMVIIWKPKISKYSKVHLNVRINIAILYRKFDNRTFREKPHVSQCKYSLGVVLLLETKQQFNSRKIHCANKVKANFFFQRSIFFAVI